MCTKPEYVNYPILYYYELNSPMSICDNKAIVYLDLNLNMSILILHVSHTKVMRGFIIQIGVWVAGATRIKTQNGSSSIVDSAHSGISIATLCFTSWQC